MSSFFDSLNFHREAHRPLDDPSGSTSYHASSSARVASHGSSSRAGSSSAVAGPSSRPLMSRTASNAARSARQETVSARRTEANSTPTTTTRPSEGASAMNEDVNDEASSIDEGPRVFWDVPPSTFIRDWAKANPPDQASTRRAGEGEAKDSRGWRDDAWTDRLLRSAAANGDPAASSRGGKWSRQGSTASTSSTTSNSTSRTNSTSAGTSGGVGPLRALKGRSSTINRRSKSLRNAKTAAGFRRHVSTSAVLDESKAGNSNSHSSALAALCGVSGENQAERVNKLLADLGLAFQEESGRGPDYEDEEGGEAVADASMDSIHTVCDPGFSMDADSATPGRSKTSTPAHTSSGKTLTAGNTPQPPLTLTASQRRLSAAGKGGLPISSWERTLTFPPSGSPAAGGPQFRTGEAMPVVTDIEVESDDEDGFWDEALLADLPLLSGIEEDQQGYFSGGAAKPSSQPSLPASPKPAVAAAALGKRRDPPTPSPEEAPPTNVAGRPTEDVAASTTESRSPSPTKMQRWSRASSRGASRMLPDSAAQSPTAAGSHNVDAVQSVEPALRSRTRSAAAAAVKESATSPIAAVNPAAAPPADQGSAHSRATTPTSPATAAAPKPVLRSSTAGTTRQPDRASSSPSPFRSTITTTTKTTPNTATSNARRAASPATFYGASPSTSTSASTTGRSLTTGMTTSRPAGLSRRSAGLSGSLSAGSGMTLLRGSAATGGRRGSGESGAVAGGGGASEKVKAGFKMPSRRALPAVPTFEASSARGATAGGGGSAEDDSFGELEGIDAADLDLEEIERVMSANGY